MRNSELRDSCVVVLANVPWEWSTDYVNQTAKWLSRNNLVICMCWHEAVSLKEVICRSGNIVLFKKIQKNILLYNGIHIFPFRRYDLVQRINLFLNVHIVRGYILLRTLLRTRVKRKILWFFDPRMGKISKLFGSSYTNVYDCVDYYRGDSQLSTREQLSLETLENEIIRRVDVVAVNSKVLYDIHKRIREDILLVPQGFRLDTFKKIKLSTILLSRDKPIIGYVGAINDRLDYPLLVQLAADLPMYEFVFVGPILDISTIIAAQHIEYAKRYLFTKPNVRYLGIMSKNDIPGIIRQFDVGIIPYRVDDLFNVNSFPMKLFEYFYMGKPVLSTPIEELKLFSEYVRIGSTIQDWEEHVASLLSKSWFKEYQKRQRRLAIANSWEKKILKILQIIKSD